MKPEYTQRIPWLTEHDPDHLFDHLYSELEWLEETPARKEYFMSTDQLTYAYGSGTFSRTYFSNPFSNPIEDMRRRLNNALEADFNVCFLNRYDSEQNHLGWHADDSPEMNPDHPIAVVSVGAEREIWWKPIGAKGEIPSDQRQLLHSGSLFIMPAGFQQKFLHRIPKLDRLQHGTRISLTFRNYRKPL